jgi:hypothetical protein
MHPDLEAIYVHRNPTSVDALITTLPKSFSRAKFTIIQNWHCKLSIYFYRATEFWGRHKRIMATKNTIGLKMGTDVS